MYGLNRWATSSEELTRYIETIPARIEAVEGYDRQYLDSLKRELERELAWLEAVGL